MITVMVLDGKEHHWKKYLTDIQSSRQATNKNQVGKRPSQNYTDWALENRAFQNLNVGASADYLRLVNTNLPYRK